MSWLKKWLFKYKNQLRIIPMDKKEFWRVWQEMSHISKIKDMFELQKQRARIQYMETDEQKYKGYVELVDEILDNMKTASKEIDEMGQKEEAKDKGYEPRV